MVAGPIWSSIGVTILLSSVSSSEFELPALSELTKEPGLMGEPEVMDLPPRIDLKSEKLLNDEIYKLDIVFSWKKQNIKKRKGTF